MNERVKVELKWVWDRLGENSTWRGLVLLATALGVTFKPEEAEKIIAGGLALVGAINVLRQGAPTKGQVAEALASKADKE